MEVYYYARNGGKMGPYSRQQIVEKIKTNEIYMSDLLWSPNFADWIPVSNTEFAPPQYRKLQRAYFVDMPDFSTIWCYVGNIWLALLGVLFFLDQVFVMKDNPFVGLRALIFYPWFFFSIVANAFIFWSHSVEKKEFKNSLLCTGIIMLITIWFVLAAQVCWGIAGEIKNREEERQLSKNMAQFKRKLRELDALWGD